MYGHGFCDDCSHNEGVFVGDVDSVLQSLTDICRRPKSCLRDHFRLVTWDARWFGDSSNSFLKTQTALDKSLSSVFSDILWQLWQHLQEGMNDISPLKSVATIFA